MWRDYRWHGFPIISTWIDEAGEGETADMSELWSRISSEVASANALVIYIEPQDLPLKGALIEVGMALALGKSVFAVMPGFVLESPSLRPVGSWLRHPLVTISPALDVALNAAKSVAAPVVEEAPRVVAWRVEIKQFHQLRHYLHMEVRTEKEAWSIANELDQAAYNPRVLRITEEVRTKESADGK